MPLHIVFGVWPFVRTLVASISEDIRLLPVQQTVGFDHIVDVARCAAHGVHQTGISVHADVRLHAEEPLLALLALVHLRVSFTAGVLGRARCGDQRGIDHCAAAQHQALGTQQQIDGCQDSLGQLVLLQHMAESQDGALVGQPVIPAAQAGEVAEQGHVVQRPSMAGSLNVNHCCMKWMRSRDSTGTADGRVCLRGMNGAICATKSDHGTTRSIVEELPAARALRRRSQSKAALFHGALWSQATSQRQACPAVLQTFLSRLRKYPTRAAPLLT